MALININNANVVQANIPGINSVAFNYLGVKPTAIQPIDRLTGVFISDNIIADDGFVRWLDATWEGDQNELNVGFFVRSANKALTNEKWFGPYYNSTFELGMQNGRYLQFMAVMTTDTTYIPKVRNINLRYITSNASTKFYTKAFDLGFKPETILLTFNGDISEDTIVRFSVAGDDSLDPLDYQRIEPNQIETLTDISVYADKVKILMELAGEFTSDVAIHEFAFMVGGNDVERINKFELASTSTSMSSISSESSSSSIDSSSSFSSSSESTDSSSSSS